MNESDNSTPAFLKKLVVVNIGLEKFVQSLEDQDAEVVHVSWKPPAIENDDEIQSILDQIL